MSDGQQPRAEWIFPDQKKSNKGRGWLIAGLVVFALVIIGALLFFLIPRGEDSTPSATPTSEASTSAPTPGSSPSAAPSGEPDSTQPPVPDPDLETFTAQVQPRLDDAVHGLDLVSNNLDLGAQIVESLQQDATILSDTPAPSSIADDWSAAVAQYATKLVELRATYDDGSDPQPALDAATAALQEVRALVGL